MYTRCLQKYFPSLPSLFRCKFKIQSQVINMLLLSGCKWSISGCCISHCCRESCYDEGCSICNQSKNSQLYRKQFRSCPRSLPYQLLEVLAHYLSHENLSVFSKNACSLDYWRAVMINNFLPTYREY